MIKIITLQIIFYLTACGYWNQEEEGKMIDIIPSDFKLTADNYCSTSEAQKFDLQVRVDQSNEFFDDPDVQFELEFLCSVSLFFRVVDSQDNTISYIKQLSVFQIENDQSLDAIKNDQEFIFNSCSSFPIFNFNIEIPSNFDNEWNKPNRKIIIDFLMTNNMPKEDMFSIKVERTKELKTLFSNSDELLVIPLQNTEFTYPYEKGCFYFQIQKPGCYLNLQNSMITLEFDNSLFGDDQLLGFEEYDNCILKVNGEDRQTDCEKLNNKIIQFKNVFNQDDKDQFNFGICDYKPQLPSKKYNYILKLYSFNSLLFFNGKVEVQQEAYVQKTFDFEFQSNYFNEDFVLDINIKFDQNNLQPLENIKILLEIPPDFVNYINQDIILETNNSSNQKQINQMVLYSQQKQNLFAQIRDIQPNDKNGLNLKITGFKIPQILGDKNFYIKILDMESSYETLSKQLIIEPLKVVFNPRPFFQKGFMIQLSSTNLNSLVNCKIIFEIPSREEDQLLDIIIYLGAGLKIDEKQFKGLQNLSDTKYQDVIYNNSQNEIKLVGVQTIQNAETFFTLELQGLRTSFHTTGQQFIKIDVYNEGKNQETMYDYYTLHQLNIDIKKNSLKILKDQFELTFEFTLDNSINFPNFLRINLEKSFYLKEENLCVSDTNLPINQNQDQVICKLGVDTLNDDYKENHNFLIDSGLNNAQKDKEYFITIKGNLNETLSKNQIFKVDIIPKFEDQQQLEKFQVNSQTISNTNQYVIELNCPQNCDICYSSQEENLECFQCIDEYIIDIQTKKCIKVSILNNKSNDNQQIDLPIINYDYLNVVEKIFIGLFTSFFPCIIIIGLYLKKTFKKSFNILIYFVVLETILQYILNYFLLIVSWNFVLNWFQLSLMNIFIGCFILFNIIFCLVVFNRKNDMMKNIRIFGMSSNSSYLILFYCIFGSGTSLWIIMYKFTESYNRIFLNDISIKKSRNQIKFLNYINFFCFFFITIAAGILFFIKSTSNSRIKYFYLINGLITSILYLVCIKFSRSNENFSFAQLSLIDKKGPKNSHSIGYNASYQKFNYKYLKEEDLSDSELSIETHCEEIRPYLESLKNYYNLKSQKSIQLKFQQLNNK